jgi:hypothetical protein
MAEQAVPDVRIFRHGKAIVNNTYLRSITLNVKSRYKEIDENPFNKNEIISSLYIDGETNGRSANKSTSHNYKLNV